MLKLRTLFSGIGSPEMALKALGIEYEVIDFCEIDKYAVKSYCAIHNIDSSKNLGDITKVWGRNLPYADMMVWGFPCQDISVAGKMRGIKEGETRSGLYYEGFRILKETKPKYSVIENVKALTSKKFKADFEQMLSDIESLGYNNYWKVLNAKDYGIPQNRERVFIVSIRKDVDDGHFEFPAPQLLKLRLKDMLEDEVEEKYYLSQKMLQGLNFHNERHEEKGTGFIWKPKNEDDIANCLRANASFCPTDNSIKIIGHSGTGGERGYIHDTDGISSCLSATDYKQPKQILEGVPIKTANSLGYDIAVDGDSINLQFPNSKTRRGRVGHQVAQTLETACNQGVLEQVGMLDMKGNEQVRRVDSAEGISPTLNTMQGGHRQPKIIAMRGRYNEDGSTSQQLEPREDGCTNTITTVQKDNLVLENNDYVARKYNQFVEKNGYIPEYFSAYNTQEVTDIAPTQNANSGTSPTHSGTVLINQDYRIRKLTPLECWKLMGFSDEDFYKAKAVNSDTQIYKQCGNSIVKQVLMAIFKNLLEVK